MSLIDQSRLRSFGLLVGAGFALIALSPLRHSGEIRVWALLIAVLLVLAGLIAPMSLKKPFQAWMALGHMLGWVNSRIILSVVFFLVITPIGLIKRLFSGDTMELRKPKSSKSYFKRENTENSDLEKMF